MKMAVSQWRSSSCDGDSTAVTKSQHCRSGFTLFELLLVVSILALVAVISAVGFRTTMLRARQQQALEAWLLADHQVRILARKTNLEYRLKLDQRRGSFYREPVDGGESVRIGRLEKKFVLKANGPDSTSFSAKEAVEYFTDGRSANYLVCSGRCLIVIGATGQTVEVKNEEEATKLLEERAVVD